MATIDSDVQRGCSSSCPSPDTLIDLVQGRLDPSARLAVLEQVSECASCAAALQVINAMHQVQPAAEAKQVEHLAMDRAEPEPIAPIRPRRSLPSWLGLAAALVGIAIALPLLLERAGRDAVEVQRSAVQAVQPADGSRLAAFPAQFSWPPVDAATGYRLRIYNSGGELLEERSSPAASIALSPPEQAHGRFIWEVDAQTASGGVRLGSWHFVVPTD